MNKASKCFSAFRNNYSAAKKSILTAIIILYGFVSFAQSQPGYAPPVFTKLHYTWMQIDSAMHIPVRNCICMNYSDSIKNDTLPELFEYDSAHIFKGLYVYAHRTYYAVSGTGGNYIDTTSLSNRINLRMMYADTANMLLPYLQLITANGLFYPLSSNPAGYSVLPLVVNALQVKNAGGAVSWQSGTYSALPSAGINGRFYLATDSLKIYFDNGSGWLVAYGGAKTISGDATGTISGTNIPVSVTAIRGATIPSLTNGFLKQSSGSWVYDNSVYITGNQSIFFSPSGDISGTATSPTSLMPALTVTGIQGKSLPTLAAGIPRYTGSAWVYDNNAYLTSVITYPSSGGHSLIKTNNTNTIYQPAIRDSILAHILVNTDSSWTFYVNKIGLTTDVTGLLPHANIASTGITPGSYTNINATVQADGTITAVSNGSSGAPTYPNTTNKYFNGYGNFPSLNTDSITEGSTNKFYTNSRAIGAISANAPILYSAGVISADTSSGMTHLATQAYVRNNAGGSSLVDSSVQQGVEYYKTSWSNLSDFVNSIGAGASISGTLINISGYTNLGNALYINDTVPFNSPYFKIRFQILDTPSATTYGIGIGILSVAGNTNCELNLTTGTGAGTISLPGFTSVYSSGSPITFARLDTIELSLRRDGKFLTVTATDLNNGSNVYSVTYTYASGVGNSPAIATYGILQYGGNYNVNTVYLSSNDRQYPYVGFIGDSKTVGVGASDISKGYVGLANSYLQNGDINITPVRLFAVGYGRSSTIASVVNGIIKSHVKIVFNNIGSNDLRNSVPNATWWTNYKNINSTLAAAGITVYNLLPFPEASLNYLPYVDSIIAHYPANSIIDTWDPLLSAPGGTTLNAAYNSGDNIHLNDAGYSLVFRTILKSGLLDKFVNFKAKSNAYAPVTLGGGSVINNLAVGVGVLGSNSVGNQNFGAGFLALANSISSDNTAVGYFAANALTSGNFNTVVGANALASDTSGSENTAMGYGALLSNISGGHNTAFGRSSLASVTTGTGNSAFGWNSLSSTTTTSQNAAFGASSMHVVTGDYNAAFGNASMSAATSATQNAAFGYSALGSATLTGSNNVAVGTNAMAGATSANYNTGVGQQALYNLSSGAGNVAIGAYAGQNVTTTGNHFYVNNISQASLSDDSTYSLVYGTFSGSAASTTGQYLKANGMLYSQHDLGMGTAPSTGSLGTNVSSATCTGTDKHYQISVTTSGAVSGNICVVTFNWSYTSGANAAFPVISPVNSATATACTLLAFGKSGGATTTATLSFTCASAGTYYFNVSQ